MKNRKDYKKVIGDQTSYVLTSSTFDYSNLDKYTEFVKKTEKDVFRINEEVKLCSPTEKSK